MPLQNCSQQQIHANPNLSSPKQSAAQLLPLDRMHLYVYVWYVSALGTNLRVLGIFRNKIISALALSTGDESETETADREVR